MKVAKNKNYTIFRKLRKNKAELIIVRKINESVTNERINGLIIYRLKMLNLEILV